MIKRKKIIFLLILFLSLSISIAIFLKKDLHSVLSTEEELYYRILNLSEVKEIFEDDTHLFIDTRDEFLYKLGHIKGSVNFPLEKFNQIIYDFERKYPKNIRIVIYCNGSQCSSSYSLAKMLIGREYTEISVFFGGWNNWVNSNYPIERSNEL